MTRRFFMAFLGSLAPGMALARAGMGSTGPLIGFAYIMPVLAAKDRDWLNEGAAAAEWERIQATPQRPTWLTARMPRRPS